MTGANACGKSTLADLVGMERFSHQSLFKGFDKKIMRLEEALEVMGLKDIAKRCVDEVSGGQRQRVWIAMAVAKQTDILLFDEPTTFLDIAYRVEILDLPTHLNRKKGTTIVMVLPDINLSARYAAHIFAIHKGTLIVEGAPNEILTLDLIKKIFDIDCSVIQDPVSGSPFIVPKGRHHINFQSKIICSC